MNKIEFDLIKIGAQFTYPICTNFTRNESTLVTFTRSGILSATCEAGTTFLFYSDSMVEPVTDKHIIFYEWIFDSVEKSKLADLIP